MNFSRFKRNREETRLRETIESTLTSVCSIQRKSQLSDGLGGSIENWNDVYTRVPVAISAYKPDRKGVSVADLVNIVVDFQASLPYGTNVNEKDRLKCEGVVYEILGVNVGKTAKVPVLADLVLIR